MVETGEDPDTCGPSSEVSVETFAVSPGASRLTVPLPGFTDPDPLDKLPVHGGGSGPAASDRRAVRAASSDDAPVIPLADDCAEVSL